MGKRKVLVTATNYSAICKKGKRILEENGFEIVENTHGRPFTFEELKGLVGDISAVVAGVDTWDEAVFKLAPELKVISRFGVGVDNIDISKAKEFGIKVTNCKGINSNAVSEHTMALMLSSVRMIPRLSQTMKEGTWERAVYHEFNQLTVGLLGFGDIARKVAAKLQSFGAKLIAYDVFPNEEAAKDLNVTMVSMEDVLKKSDIISIHVPALPSTHHMINKDTIELMKDSVYLINTARGSIVDESALYEALKTRRIAGAALDVYEHEPVDMNHPLFELDNFIGTPHTSAETYENYENCGIKTAQAIVDVLIKEKTPENLL